jgi:hypothetical protein
MDISVLTGHFLNVNQLRLDAGHYDLLLAGDHKGADQPTIYPDARDHERT